MARGQFNRVRVRAGYLRCRSCGRDLPEEEFKPITRTYKNGERKQFRDSWCRPCHAAYQKERSNHLARTNPELYAERVRRSYLASERKRRQRVKEGREVRLLRARHLIARLAEVGVSPVEIEQETGIMRTSVRRWVDGAGQPHNVHLAKLEALAARLGLT